jgi:fucose permease
MLAGEICARIGNKGLAMLSLLFYVIAIVGLQIASSPLAFVVFYAFTGFGASSIAVAVNTSVPTLGLKKPGQAMTIIHFGYGVGASLALFWLGDLIPRVGWRTAYLMIGLIIAFAIGVLFFTKFPRVVQTGKQTRSDRGYWKDPSFWMLSGIFGFYLTAELGLINWFPNYMKFALGMNEGTASRMAALFFVFLTVGRLVGSFFMDRFPHKKILATFISVMALCLSVGLLVPGISAFAIALSGLFASVCFPSMMMVISEQFPNNHMRVMGAVSMVGAIVRMVGEFLVGSMTQHYGPVFGFWMIPLFLVLALGILIKLILAPRRI